MKMDIKDNDDIAKELQQRAKKLRSEYMKSWRMKNPEKVKKHHDDFWLRKAMEDYKREVNNHDTNEDD